MVIWLSGYLHRQRVPCSGSTAGEQTDYVKKIAIHKGIGTSSAGDIYLNEHSENWPYDIRFCNSLGQTLDLFRLEYDADDGAWYVELDSIAALGDTDFYIYYGRPDAEDVSSASDTFAFYDGFESGDLSGWEASHFEAQTSVTKNGAYAAKVTAKSATLRRGLTIGSLRASFYCRHESTKADFKPVTFTYQKSGIYSDYLFPVAMVGGYFKYGTGGYGATFSNLPTVTPYTVGQWYLVEVVLDFENSLFKWWIDGNYKGSASLVEANNGTVLDSDSHIYRIYSRGYTKNYSGIYSYLDDLAIARYIGPEPEWAPPGEEETNVYKFSPSRAAIRPGLYLVKRGLDTSLGPYKTIVNPAYNDSELDMVQEVGIFGDANADWVQDDRKHAILAHYEDGIATYTFSNGLSDSGKTIVDVTVSAFISGKGRTIFTRSGTKYYGTLTTRGHVAAWVDTVYTQDPATSNNWTFSALGASPIAGVDLRAPSNADYPKILNNESDPTAESPCCEFPTGGDNLIYILGSLCYCIKIIVHYYLDSDPGTILSYEMLPQAISEYSENSTTAYPTLSDYHGNAMNNGIACAYADTGIEYFTRESEDYALRPDPFYLEQEFGADAIAAIGLYSQMKVGIYGSALEYSLDSSNWHAKPYLKLGGTKYYYPTEQTDEFSNAWFFWYTNPKTGTYWVSGDLVAGDGYGIEFHWDGVGYGPYNVYVRTWFVARLDKSDGTRVLNVALGAVTCSPNTWWLDNDWAAVGSYLYYSPGPVGQLKGDMYRPFGTRTEGTTTLVKRYASDLAVMPPSFSVISGFRVDASVYAWSDRPTEDDCHWHIYVEVDGTRYYSPEYTLAGAIHMLRSQSYSWNVNPATGLAWTFDEFQGIRFGLEVSRPDKDTFVMFRPFSLISTTGYQEIAGPTRPEYIPVDFRFTSLQKNSQSPSLQADELRVRLPAGGYLPERTEIALIEDDSMVFHGFVWTAEEKAGSREIDVTAKSQQHALACRFLPYFFYHARNTRFTSVFSLADLFSDDVPIYPNESYFMQYSTNAFFYKWYSMFYNQYLEPTGAVLRYLNPTIWMLGSTYSNLGLFFMLNSLIPYGANGELETYKRIAPVAYNRLKFLTNHNPSVIPYCEAEKNLADTNGYGGWYVDEQGVNEPDDVGGVRRFRKGVSGSLALDEYAVSGEDIIAGHIPGSVMILIDHAMDTFLRPGTDDLEDKYLAVPYEFGGGSFEKSLSDYFMRLGQEVRFRNDLDGYVYMDRATEIGRDTHLRFVNGVNATVTKSLQDPAPSAVISGDPIPLISTDWKPVRIWMAKPEISDRCGTDLQEWLDLKRDDDTATWTIKTIEKLWLLMSGDYIDAQARSTGLEHIRVRKILISSTGTTITAGRQLRNISAEWGQWRAVRGSTDADTDCIIQETDIDLDGPSGNQTFAVKAEEYEQGSWKCRLQVSWELWVEDDYEASLPSPPNMFLVITLNGKVAPPGRIIAKGNSGSVDLDITELCTVSGSADQTNTIALKLWGGLDPNTYTHYGHKVSGSITQYRRMEAVSNA